MPAGGAGRRIRRRCWRRCCWPRLFYGVSDREAERRSRFDLSWKAALGLPLEHRGIPHVCLVEFRARLVKAGMEDWLHERLVGVAKPAGVIGHRRVVDSTGIADSVVTQDTVSLIRSAIRRCLGLLEEMAPSRAEACRASLARDDYDREGKPEICWASAAERQALVNDLFADACRVIIACAGISDAGSGGRGEAAGDGGRPGCRRRRGGRGAHCSAGGA